CDVAVLNRGVLQPKQLSGIEISMQFEDSHSSKAVETGPNEQILFLIGLNLLSLKSEFHCFVINMSGFRLYRVIMNLCGVNLVKGDGPVAKRICDIKGDQTESWAMGSIETVFQISEGKITFLH
ncbi:hypothetical protein ACJX0J_033564, partial [Zea mays]